MAIMITASFVGILFGLYFQVLILVPLTLSAIVYWDVAAMLVGQSAEAALLSVVVPVIALQGGYMIGLTGRDPFHQTLARFSGEQSRRA